MGEDKNAWIRHFQTLFSYIDTQKLRTPKGLAWLGHESLSAKIQAALPAQGIQDHTINRLLLMSSSEHHLSSVPMAFFIRSADAAAINPVPARLPGLS